MLRRPETAGSYFIGFENRKGYGGIGIVSVISDPDNLFGEEKGIFVQGRTYRENHRDTDRYWAYFPANFRQKGRAWEREAILEFFGADRERILAAKAGIRIKGGRTAGLMPKGLNLFARKAYDGNRVFQADLFGNGYAAKRVSLAPAVYRIKDWMISRLAANNWQIPLGFNAAAYRPQ